MTAATAGSPGVVRSLVPARMDRLPWTRFHWPSSSGSGVVLDPRRPRDPDRVASRGFAEGDARHGGGAGRPPGTVYLVGQVVGALAFGRLTDRLGRKQALHHDAGHLPGRLGPRRRLVLTCGSSGVPVHRRHGHRRRVHRDQLRHRRAHPVALPRPGRHRDQRHLLGRRVVRRPREPLPAQPRQRRREHRLAHRRSSSARVLGLSIIWLRRHIPESPRWLLTHGREEEAERTVDEIEARVRREGGELAAGRREQGDRRQAGGRAWVRQDAVGHLRRRYPRRTLLGLTMMVTQSFLYNAIFFTYALVLTNFYDIARPSTSATTSSRSRSATCSARCCSGQLFDTIGRRKMIFVTYTHRRRRAARRRAVAVPRRLAHRDDADDLLVRHRSSSPRRAPRRRT